MKQLLIIMMVIVAYSAKGQIADNTDSLNERNVYYVALKKCIELNAKNIFGKDTMHADTILVGHNYDNDIPEHIKNRIDSTHVIIVADTYTYIKEHHLKVIVLYQLFPLRYANKEFAVSIVPFGVTAKKKHGTRMVNFENGGGYKIIFRFENNQFYFVRLEEHFF